MLDTNLQVAAGEERNDMDVKKQWEMRLFEEIYPPESSIPSKYDASILLEFFSF